MAEVNHRPDSVAKAVDIMAGRSVPFIAKLTKQVIPKPRSTQDLQVHQGPPENLSSFS